MSQAFLLRMQLGSKEDRSVEGDESERTKGYRSGCSERQRVSVVVGVIDGVIVVI